MNNLTFKNFVSLKEFFLSEEKAAPHILMALEKIISSQSISNMVEVILLSQLIQLFKFSDGTDIRNLTEFPAPTSSLIHSIKALPNEDAVGLAKFFKKELDKGYSISSCWANPSAEHHQWVNWILQSQK